MRRGAATRACLRWTAIAALGASLSPPAWSAPPTDPTEATRPHPREKTLLKRKWGVDVMGVRLAGAGTMLEFRYRVLDEKKATALFERRTKPVLVHERTGAELAVPRPPKTGPLRTSNPPLEDRTYWMFFANPGRLVKPGEKVSVVIGEFRADGLVVE